MVGDDLLQVTEQLEGQRPDEEPLLRELQETAYQRTRPYVLDSSAAQATFGLTPTPLCEGLAATAACWQGNGTTKAVAV